MSTPCPDPATLAAYAERRLPALEREGVEAHLAACPDCLGEVRILVAPPVRRPVARWELAAAGLLLAVSLGLWWGLGSAARPFLTHPPPALPPGAPAPGPGAGTLLEGGGKVSRWQLPGGDRLALDADAKARVLAPGAYALLEGRMWMDVCSGQGRVIRLPGAEIRLSDAEVLVSTPSRQADTLSAVLLRSAAADAPFRAGLLCRRGRCQLLWEGREFPVPAGTAVALEPGVPPDRHALSPEAAERAEAWIWQETPANLDALAAKAEGLSVTRMGEALLLGSGNGFGRLPLGSPPAGDFRLELSVRPRRPAGDLGLAFPVRTRCTYWMMSAASLPGERWTRLVVERRGDQIRLRRDGEVSASMTAASDSMTLPSDRTALGLWGAEVEVKDLMWKVFPP